MRKCSFILRTSLSNYRAIHSAREQLNERKQLSCWWQKWWPLLPLRPVELMSQWHLLRLWTELIEILRNLHVSWCITRHHWGITNDHVWKNCKLTKLSHYISHFSWLNCSLVITWIYCCLVEDLVLTIWRIVRWFESCMFQLVQDFGQHEWVKVFLCVAGINPG